MCRGTPAHMGTPYFTGCARHGARKNKNVHTYNVKNMCCGKQTVYQYHISIILTAPHDTTTYPAGNSKYKATVCVVMFLFPLRKHQRDRSRSRAGRPKYLCQGVAGNAPNRRGPSAFPSIAAAVVVVPTPHHHLHAAAVRLHQPVVGCYDSIAVGLPPPPKRLGKGYPPHRQGGAGSAKRPASNHVVLRGTVRFGDQVSGCTRMGLDWDIFQGNSIPIAMAL